MLETSRVTNLSLSQSSWLKGQNYIDLPGVGHRPILEPYLL